MPQTIYWVNYFNKTVEENIGQHKIDEVLSQYTNITMKNGILRLKDTMSQSSFHVVVTVLENSRAQKG